MGAAAVLMPGDRVADHVIVQRVGEGAMGVVYETRNPAGETVALKLLRPEKAADPIAVRAFLDEAAATGSVRQSNVVKVLGHGEADGFHYIVMEFVDGPPLHRLLEEKGRVHWREAAKTIIQVARALEAAHAQGLLHRDVKPENILLYRDGRARLTDFGIVKDISSIKGYLLKGKRVGTAIYASPEQCLGKRLSPATDMYSLGATYYRMVCGRPPFAGETPSRVMVMHVRERPIPPDEIAPEVSKSASKLITKMLAKKQSDRVPSMTRLIEDLICLVKGRLPIAAKPRVRKPRRR